MYTDNYRSCQVPVGQNEMIAMPPHKLSFSQQINCFLHLLNIYLAGNMSTALRKMLRTSRWMRNPEMKGISSKPPAEQKKWLCRPRKGKIPPLRDSVCHCSQRENSLRLKCIEWQLPGSQKSAGWLKGPANDLLSLYSPRLESHRASQCEWSLIALTISSVGCATLPLPQSLSSGNHRLVNEEPSWTPRGRTNRQRWSSTGTNNFLFWWCWGLNSGLRTC
jgi:hypothetical protein